MKNRIAGVLPGVKENVPLAPYTTFRIGGKARYFFVAKTIKHIMQALRFGKHRKLPMFVLGGGSNVLVADEGFKGLVIQIRNLAFTIKHVTLYVEAGVLMSTIVQNMCKRGFSGLEWAGGLPGTLGGAIRGNAGAFGGEIKDSVVTVECIDTDGKVRKLTNKACKFSYRSSIFKEKNWIVIFAILKFSKGNAKDLQRIVDDHIKYRKERHPLDLPNAGSVFKNCDLKNIPEKLLEFVHPVIKIDPFPVVPVAFLIAKAGLKGLRMGNAQVSDKHPNFIVNVGGATSRDVLKLIAAIKKTVKKKFDVALETEVEHLK